MRFCLILFCSLSLFSLACDKSNDPTQQPTFPQTFVLSNNTEPGESQYGVIDNQGMVQLITDAGSFLSLSSLAEAELTDFLIDFPFNKIELLNPTTLRLYLSTPVDGVSDTTMTYVMENKLIRVALDTDEFFDIVYNATEQKLYHYVSAFIYAKKDVNTNEVSYSVLDFDNRYILAPDQYLQQKADELNLTQGDTVALNLSALIYE